jgi:hypothetical protein
MKFTAFVLASAATTASAQMFNTQQMFQQQPQVFNQGQQFIQQPAQQFIQQPQVMQQNQVLQQPQQFIQQPIQQQQLGFNPFLQQTQQNLGGVNFAPYQVQQPIQYQVQQPVQPIQYQVQQPVAPQDPLAWERDCTWINSINFRAALSMATCGATVCSPTNMPNGNGGGSDRKTVLAKASRTAGSPNGIEYHVWGSVINRAGRVCAVAYTGPDLTQQFPYGRVQAMKRANTANSLTLPKRAMPSHVADRHNYIEIETSSAGLNAGNPGRSDNGWYGFSHDRYNPGNIDVQFQGATSNYGEACGTPRQDPMCMQKPGGMDYSAGGLALFDQNGILRGAIGVAGDNDCTSHAIAWKARQQLRMDWTPVNLMRPTFNANAACVGTAVVGTTSIFKETAKELCDTTLLEPVTFTPLLTGQTKQVKYAGWAHTGALAEDNVFFSNNEARNFPACYDLIRRFPIDNPTQAVTGSTKTY